MRVSGYCGFWESSISSGICDMRVSIESAISPDIQQNGILGVPILRSTNSKGTSGQIWMCTEQSKFSDTLTLIHTFTRTYALDNYGFRVRQLWV